MSMRVRAAAARAAAPPDCPKKGHCRPVELPLPVERRNDSIEAASGESPTAGTSSMSMRETGAIVEEEAGSSACRGEAVVAMVC
jgi:hypothetical protein